MREINKVAAEEQPIRSVRGVWRSGVHSAHQDEQHEARDAKRDGVHCAVLFAPEGHRHPLQLCRPAASPRQRQRVRAPGKPPHGSKQNRSAHDRAARAPRARHTSAHHRQPPAQSSLAMIEPTPTDRTNCRHSRGLVAPSFVIASARRCISPADRKTPPLAAFRTCITRRCESQDRTLPMSMCCSPSQRSHRACHTEGGEPRAANPRTTRRLRVGTSRREHSVSLGRRKLHQPCPGAP